MGLRPRWTPRLRADFRNTGQRKRRSGANRPAWIVQAIRIGGGGASGAIITEHQQAEALARLGKGETCRCDALVVAVAARPVGSGFDARALKT